MVYSSNFSMIIQFIDSVQFLMAYIYKYFIKGIIFIPKADLYYLHQFFYYPAIRFLCFIYRSKYVYDAHDFYRGIEKPEQKALIYNRFLGPIFNFIENSCIKNSFFFITVSDGIASCYEKETGFKPMVYRNFHDHRIEETSHPNLKKRINIEPNSEVIVVVGMAKNGQKFDEVLNAIAELDSNIHLVLVGNGYRQIVENSYKNNKLKGRIHTIPNIPATSVVPLIRDASASIIIYFPLSINYLKALPNGFFQSIAAGLPIIYSPLPEITKICDQNHIGIKFDINDSTSIEDAIKLALHSKDDDLKNKYDKIRYDLSWENEEKGLLKLLHSM